MKVYVICFDNKEMVKVFADKALAEERMKALQDAMDAEAAVYGDKSYSHWYSVEEMEVEHEN